MIIKRDPDGARTLTVGEWLALGVVTVLASVAAVLAAEVLARSLWPEVALFQPLDSYPRAAVFTLVPVVIATIWFRWLTRNNARPERTFLIIAAVVLLVSFIPDYILPVPNRTLLASTVTASLHVVAGVVAVGLLIGGRRRLHSR